MKNYRWSCVVMLRWLCCMVMANAAAEKVMPIKTETACTPIDNDRYLEIKQPGHYCLTHDVKRTCPPRWVYLGESSCSLIVIHINADDVDLDFRGHTLTSKSSGISIESLHGKRVTIRNGILIGATSIDFRGAKGPPPATAMPDKELRSVKLLGPGKPERVLPFNPHIEYEDLDATVEKTGYVIENMVIDSEIADTIMMNGAGNIVRNNRLHIRAINLVDKEGKALKDIDDGSSGPAHYPDVRVGILNYGENTLIENNEIIQKTDNKGVIPAYSIYLRKADGSIVRGNTVKLSGTKEKTVAIGLRDTQNAVIENNKIIGAETPIEQVGETSSQQNNNQFK